MNGRYAKIVIYPLRAQYFRTKKGYFYEQNWGNLLITPEPEMVALYIHHHRGARGDFTCKDLF